MVTKETLDNKLPDTFLSEEDESRLLRIAESNERLKISVTNDYAFKTVFRNTKVLKGLLSAVLKIPEEEIKEIELPDTTVNGEYPEDKTGILDIRVHLNRKQKINIEMQVLPFPFWEERTLFYLCRMFVEGLKHGMNYGELEKCIHISILEYNLFEDGEYYTEIGICDLKTGHMYSDKLSLRVIQLNQLEKATEEEKQTGLYLWGKLISARDWEVLEMLAKENESMEEAVKELEKINADPKKRYEYLYREMKEWDEVTIRDYFTNQGKLEGEIKGKREGAAEESARYSRLIMKLSEADRMQDIVKAASDPQVLKALYKEFGI